MKKYIVLLAATLGVNTLSAVHMCIVGGSRGAGYNLAMEVLKDPDSTCTLLTRKPEEVEPLYSHLENKPTIVKGKVTEETGSLIGASQGADYIVMAQTFPYKIWDKSLRKMTTHCVDAAITTGATLVYYGRVYAKGIIKDEVGNILPIKEDSAPNFDNIPKGQGSQSKTLNDIEMQIADSSCKSVIIRHGYPWGPNTGDGLLHKNFTEIARSSTRSWFSSASFRWIGSDTTSTPVTYLPDLSRFTLQYLALLPVQEANHAIINYAGDNVDGIKDIGEAYMNLCDLDYDSDIVSKGKLSIGASFNKEAKRAKDVYYAFVNEILLDETARKSLFTFTSTPREQAIQQTYDWYAEKVK